eukprot:CAMPEP_0201484446 /NCGR_PEP_ID=MMETSP0151_2-20130828/8633_1 /ASSEMBLY_ACC=CAM_ASM_000257 /TAXON_ID=200890 /ORGANISM="Paramoeba atlantica, Strain 621/1 / CCAP 1560/9" /LENGTH=107 /DNA_ID=CAMNT_0047868125 /DNA_START=46 /DNA_END=366 /DNA_ORIENTATION=-
MPLKLRGNISWEYLPQTFHVVRLAEQELQGQMKSDLPPELQQLMINENDFLGPLDYDLLPETMKLFVINGNYLGGSTDLAHLPHGMQRFEVPRNNIKGTICMALLPR